MLKKKNIAMMTAALTATTAVTPAFAATVNRAITTATDIADSEKKQEVVDTFKKLLETTYTNDKDKLANKNLAGESVYTVVLTGTIEGVSNTVTVATAGEFEVLMNKVQKDDEFTITATSKGFRTETDGSVVDWDNYTFETVRVATSEATLKDLVDEKLSALNNEAIKVNGVRLTPGSFATTNATVGGPTTGTTAKVDINENGVEIDGKATTHSTILTIKGSDVSKDFTKPVYSEDGYIVNFEEARESIAEIEDLTTPVKTVDVVCTSDETVNAEKVTIDASTLVEEGRLTIDGNELKNKISNLENAKLTNKYGKLVGLVAAQETSSNSVLKVKEDVNTTATTMYQVEQDSEITYVDSKTSKFTITVRPDLGYAYQNGYKLTATNSTIAVNNEVTSGNTVFNQNPIEIITVEGAHAEVQKAFAAINGTVDVNTLAGMDRYQTAVEVSKDEWTTASTVVLVGGEALVDGLSATPYAASKNAPILLTEKGKLNVDTKAEIARLGAKNVHIIGGTAAVSEDVVDELGAMGLNVTRIAGEDRYETSLEVAKRLTSTSTVYVAQGDAMADALSISAVAGQSGSPILLTEKESINKDVKNFIENKNVQDAYVIGGEDVISKSVVNELNKIASRVKVLGGLDRFETNAKIIDQFYSGANKADEVILVNGDKGLVDALSAGAYAGQTSSKSVLVLTGDDLSTTQKVEIKDNVNAVNVKTQVGYQVAAKVIKTLKDLF